MTKLAWPALWQAADADTVTSYLPGGWSSGGVQENQRMRWSILTPDGAPGARLKCNSPAQEFWSTTNGTFSGFPASASMVRE
jgi:hypothetical protein